MALTANGRRTPASGALWFQKGDVVTDSFLIEAKRTDKNSMSIRLDVWEKIRREALLSGRIPLLAVEIRGREFVVLDLEDFFDLASVQGDLGEGELPGGTD